MKGALDAKLAVILDLHEFHAMAEDPVGRKEMLLAFWRQVAPRFKDAPDDVVFELLNEPFGKLTPELWNEYLKEALAVVRQTNPTRVVVIGPGQWNGIQALPQLELPEDDRNLIATVHYYHPMEFTHQGAPWATEWKDKLGVAWTGTDQERRRVELDFGRRRRSGPRRTTGRCCSASSGPTTRPTWTRAPATRRTSRARPSGSAGAGPTGSSTATSSCTTSRTTLGRAAAQGPRAVIGTRVSSRRAAVRGAVNDPTDEHGRAGARRRGR